MLKTQARQFGESLVDRHVLSREVLEDAIDESGPHEPPVADDRRAAGPRRRQGPGRGPLRRARHPLRRLRRHRRPAAGRARRARAARSPVHARSASRWAATPSWSRSPTRRTTPRSREVSGAVQSADGLRRRRRRRRAATSCWPRSTTRTAGPTRRPSPRSSAPGSTPTCTGCSSGCRSSARPTSTSPRASRRSPASSVTCSDSTDFPALSGSRIRELVYSIITKRQQQEFEETHELDTNYTVPGVARYRVNIYLKRNAVAVVVPPDPLHRASRSTASASPNRCATSPELPRGLVLVTGPTGSGKSTTLASLIDVVNQERPVPHHHDRGARSSSCTSRRWRS